MNVHVDESRHDISAVKVNDLITTDIRIIINDVFDLPVFYQNCFAKNRLHVPGTVQNDSVSKCILFHSITLQLDDIIDLSSGQMKSPSLRGIAV